MPEGLPVLASLETGDDVGLALVEGRLLGDRLEGFGHDVVDIVGEKRQRVHGSYIDTAVPAVTIAHHVADGVAVVCGCLGHTGSHQTGIVGLNLEVDVVGMRIVLPVARGGRLHTLQDIVAGTLVGVPQGVFGIGEGVGKLADGSVQPFLLKYLYEGEVHVDVVIQTGERVVVVFHPGVVPYYLGLVGDYLSVVLELSRTTKGAAYGLSCPATLDFVLQGGTGHGYGLCRGCDSEKRRKCEGADFHCFHALYINVFSL